MKINIALKIIAAVVTITFTTTTICQSAPSVYSINVPEKFGKITQRYRARPTTDKEKDEGRGTRDENRLIIHIQDAHASFEAQKNLAQIICSLLPQIKAYSVPRTQYSVNKELTPNEQTQYAVPSTPYNTPFIGIEGAIGSYDLKNLRDFPIHEAKETVAADYVKEGKFIGAEYANIIANQDFTLYGLEDKELFTQDFKAFYQVSVEQKELAQFIAELEAELAQLKAAIYNPKLMEFDFEAACYENGEIAPLEYLPFLYEAMHISNIDILRFVQLAQFKEVLALQQGIDQAKLEREAEALTQRIVQSTESRAYRKPEIRNPKSETNSNDKKSLPHDAAGSPSSRMNIKAKNDQNEKFETLRHSDLEFVSNFAIRNSNFNTMRHAPCAMQRLKEYYEDYTSSTLPQREFLLYLTTLANEYNIPATEYKNIQRSLAYCNKYNLIDMGKLLREVLNVNNEIRTQRAIIEDEHTLITITRKVTDLKQLLALRALREDVERFRENKEEYSIGVIQKQIRKLQQKNTIIVEINRNMSPAGTKLAAEISGNSIEIDRQTMNFATEGSIFHTPNEVISTNFAAKLNLDSILQLVDTFYSLADQRNTAMLDNLIAKMDEAGQKVGVLVAGGYHSYGLTELMKERNISFVTVTPQISSSVENVAYMDRMLGNIAPIDPILTSHFQFSRINATQRTLNKLDYDRILDDAGYLLHGYALIDPTTKQPLSEYAIKERVTQLTNEKREDLARAIKELSEIEKIRTEIVERITRGEAWETVIREVGLKVSGQKHLESFVGSMQDELVGMVNEERPQTADRRLQTKSKRQDSTLPVTAEEITSIQHDIDALLRELQNSLMDEIQDLPVGDFLNIIDQFATYPQSQCPTMYQLSKPPSLDELHKMATFNGEIIVMKIRSSNQWLMMLSTRNNRYVDMDDQELLERLMLSDSISVVLHNHNLGHQPTPSLSDISTALWSNARMFLVSTESILEFTTDNCMIDGRLIRLRGEADFYDQMREGGINVEKLYEYAKAGDYGNFMAENNRILSKIGVEQRVTPWSHADKYIFLIEHEPLADQIYSEVPQTRLKVIRIAYLLATRGTIPTDSAVRLLRWLSVYDSMTEVKLFAHEVLMEITAPEEEVCLLPPDKLATFPVVNLWEDERVKDMARDIAANGVMENNNFTEEECDDTMIAASPSFRGLYKYHNGVEVLRKQRSNISTISEFFCTEHPTCCPTFFVDNDPEHEYVLHLPPFGYIELYHITGHTLANLSRELYHDLWQTISATFTAGERWFIHDDLNVENIMVLMDRDAVLRDIKIIDWEGIEELNVDEYLELKELYEGKRDNLRNAHIVGKYLVGCDLRGIDMTKVNLEGKQLLWTHFGNAILRGANLRSAIIMAVNFDGADLSGADLRGAHFLKGAFDRSLLRQTKFSSYHAPYFRKRGYTVVNGGDWCEVTSPPEKVPPTNDGRGHSKRRMPPLDDVRGTKDEEGAEREVRGAVLVETPFDINISDDYDAMSELAAWELVENIKRTIQEKDRCVVCFATGATPQGMYKILVERYAHEIEWSKVITFNLDEFILEGFDRDPLDHLASFRSEMEEHLFRHLYDHGLKKENINFLNGAATDSDAEIARFKQKLHEVGPIDICLLGIGTNSHMAYCEPGTDPTLSVHKATLADSSVDAIRDRFKAHGMKVPTHALTMGIRDILQSQHIMLLASGESKARAIAQTVLEPKNIQCPASALQDHDNVSIYLDHAAAQLLMTNTEGSGPVTDPKQQPAGGDLVEDTGTVTSAEQVTEDRSPVEPTDLLEEDPGRETSTYTEFNRHEKLDAYLADMMRRSFQRAEFVYKNVVEMGPGRSGAPTFIEDWFSTITTLVREGVVDSDFTLVGIDTDYDVVTAVERKIEELREANIEYVDRINVIEGSFENLADVVAQKGALDIVRALHLFTHYKTPEERMFFRNEVRKALRTGRMFVEKDINMTIIHTKDKAGALVPSELIFSCLDQTGFITVTEHIQRLLKKYSEYDFSDQKRTHIVPVLQALWQATNTVLAGRKNFIGYVDHKYTKQNLYEDFTKLLRESLPDNVREHVRFTPEGDIYIPLLPQSNEEGISRRSFIVGGIEAGIMLSTGMQIGVSSAKKVAHQAPQSKAEKIDLLVRKIILESERSYGPFAKVIALIAQWYFATEIRRLKEVISQLELWEIDLLITNSNETFNKGRTVIRHYEQQVERIDIMGIKQALQNTSQYELQESVIITLIEVMEGLLYRSNKWDKAHIRWWYELPTINSRFDKSYFRFGTEPGKYEADDADRPEGFVNARARKQPYDELVQIYMFKRFYPDEFMKIVAKDPIVAAKNKVVDTYLMEVKEVAATKSAQPAALHVPQRLARLTSTYDSTPRTRRAFLRDFSGFLGLGAATVLMRGERARVPIYDDTEIALYELPTQIARMLKVLGLTKDEVRYAKTMIEMLRNIYAGMDENETLIKRHYHNHLHNLIVTYAMLLFVEKLAAQDMLEDTVRDVKVAFLAAQFHDFHVRTVFDQRGVGTPAFVEETLNQLADLMGVKDYVEPVISNGRYRELAKKDTEALRATLYAFLGVDPNHTEDLHQWYHEIVTLIRRTDVATDIPLPAHVQSETKRIRHTIDEVSARQINELRTVEVDIIQEFVTNVFGDLLTAAGQKDDAATIAGLKRQRGIEQSYITELDQCSPHRRAVLHRLAFHLEKGADQGGRHLLCTPRCNDQILQGMMRENHDIKPETEILFYRGAILQPEVLEIFVPFDVSYKENLVANIEHYAEIARRTLAKRPQLEQDTLPAGAAVTRWQAMRIDVLDMLGLFEHMLAVYEQELRNEYPIIWQQLIDIRTQLNNLTAAEFDFWINEIEEPKVRTRDRNHRRRIFDKEVFECLQVGPQLTDYMFRATWQGREVPTIATITQSLQDLHFSIDSFQKRVLAAIFPQDHHVQSFLTQIMPGLHAIGVSIQTLCEKANQWTELKKKLDADSDDELRSINAILDSSWVDLLHRRPGAVTRRVSEAFLLRDHPFKDDVFSKADREYGRLSFDELMRRVNTCLQSTPSAENQYVGLYREMLIHSFEGIATLRKAFLHAEGPPHDLSQLLIDNIPLCTRVHIKRILKRGDQVEIAKLRGLLQSIYLIYRAMQALSEKEDYVLIRDEDIGEIVRYYQRADVIGDLKEKELAGILDLAELFTPADTPAKQESLRNFIQVLAGLEETVLEEILLKKIKEKKAELEIIYKKLTRTTATITFKAGIEERWYASMALMNVLTIIRDVLGINVVENLQDIILNLGSGAHPLQWPSVINVDKQLPIMEHPSTVRILRDDFFSRGFMQKLHEEHLSADEKVKFILLYNMWTYMATYPPYGQPVTSDIEHHRRYRRQFLHQVWSRIVAPGNYLLFIDYYPPETAHQPVISADIIGEVENYFRTELKQNVETIVKIRDRTSGYIVGLAIKKQDDIATLRSKPQREGTGRTTPRTEPDQDEPAVNLKGAVWAAGITLAGIVIPFLAFMFDITGNPYTMLISLPFTFGFAKYLYLSMKIIQVLSKTIALIPGMSFSHAKAVLLYTPIAVEKVGLFPAYRKFFSTGWQKKIIRHERLHELDYGEFIAYLSMFPLIGILLYAFLVMRKNKGDGRQIPGEQTPADNPQAEALSVVKKADFIKEHIPSNIDEKDITWVWSRVVQASLPMFPSVWPITPPHYNFLEALLDSVISQLEKKPGVAERVLVIGSGVGLEAVLLAQMGFKVDAIDSNPVAVANTRASAKVTNTDNLIRAWISDGLSEVTEEYDYIFYVAPAPVAKKWEERTVDPAEYDLDGEGLTNILHELHEHLAPGGQFYLAISTTPEAYDIFDQFSNILTIHPFVKRSWISKDPYIIWQITTKTDRTSLSGADEDSSPGGQTQEEGKDERPFDYAQDKQGTNTDSLWHRWRHVFQGILGIPILITMISINNVRAWALSIALLVVASIIIIRDEANRFPTPDAQRATPDAQRATPDDKEEGPAIALVKDEDGEWVPYTLKEAQHKLINKVWRESYDEWREKYALFHNDPLYLDARAALTEHAEELKGKLPPGVAAALIEQAKKLPINIHSPPNIILYRKLYKANRKLAKKDKLPPRRKFRLISHPGTYRLKKIDETNGTEKDVPVIINILLPARERAMLRQMRDVDSEAYNQWLHHEVAHLIDRMISQRGEERREEAIATQYRIFRFIEHYTALEPIMDELKRFRERRELKHVSWLTRSKNYLPVIIAAGVAIVFSHLFDILLHIVQLKGMVYIVTGKYIVPSLIAIYWLKDTMTVLDEIEELSRSDIPITIISYDDDDMFEVPDDTDSDNTGIAYHKGELTPRKRIVGKPGEVADPVPTDNITPFAEMEFAELLFWYKALIFAEKLFPAASIEKEIIIKRLHHEFELNKDMVGTDSFSVWVEQIFVKEVLIPQALHVQKHGYDPFELQFDIFKTKMRKKLDTILANRGVLTSEKCREFMRRYIRMLMRYIEQFQKTRGRKFFEDAYNERVSDQEWSPELQALLKDVDLDPPAVLYNTPSLLTEEHVREKSDELSPKDDSAAMRQISTVRRELGTEEADLIFDESNRAQTIECVLRDVIAAVKKKLVQSGIDTRNIELYTPSATSIEIVDDLFFKVDGERYYGVAQKSDTGAVKIVAPETLWAELIDRPETAKAFLLHEVYEALELGTHREAWQFVKVYFPEGMQEFITFMIARLTPEEKQALIDEYEQYECDFYSERKGEWDELEWEMYLGLKEQRVEEPQEVIARFNRATRKVLNSPVNRTALVAAQEMMQDEREVVLLVKDSGIQPYELPIITRFAYQRDISVVTVQELNQGTEELPDDVLVLYVGIEPGDEREIKNKTFLAAKVYLGTNDDVRTIYIGNFPLIINALVAEAKRQFGGIVVLQGFAGVFVNLANFVERHKDLLADVKRELQANVVRTAA